MRGTHQHRFAISKFRRVPWKVQTRGISKGLFRGYSWARMVDFATPICNFELSDIAVDEVVFVQETLK